MKKLGLFLLICGILGVAGMASADTAVFSEGFDNLNLGSLNEQNGWFVTVSGTENVFQVENSVYQQGGQAINATSTSVNAFIYHNFSSLSQGRATVYIRFNAPSMVSIRLNNDTTNIAKFLVYYLGDGITELRFCDYNHPTGYESGALVLGNLETNTWYKLQVEWKDGLIRGRYNDGTWSDWLNPINSFTTVNRIGFGFGTGWTMDSYWDSILVEDTSTPPPPPPPPSPSETTPASISLNFIEELAICFIWVLIGCMAGVAVLASIPLIIRLLLKIVHWLIKIWY